MLGSDGRVGTSREIITDRCGMFTTTGYFGMARRCASGFYVCLSLMPEGRQMTGWQQISVIDNSQGPLNADCCAVWYHKVYTIWRMPSSGRGIHYFLFNVSLSFKTESSDVIKKPAGNLFCR